LCCLQPIDFLFHADIGHHRRLKSAAVWAS